MSTALKKINARVKQLQKKHPKSKRVTLQKQAGKEYKAGKLSGKKKRKAPAKKKVVKARRRSAPRKVAKRKTVRRKAVSRVSGVTVGRKRKRVYRAAVKKHRRRVSGSGKSSIMPVIAIAGLGLVAYMLLKPKTTLPPITLQTPAGQSSANNIVAYATAAGLGISALTKLIQSLNSGGDTAAVSAANTLQTTGQLPASFSLADDLAGSGALSNPTAINFGI